MVGPMRVVALQGEAHDSLGGAWPAEANGVGEARVAGGDSGSGGDQNKYCW